MLIKKDIESTIELALKKYLVCPEDEGKLNLQIGGFDNKMPYGNAKCEKCGKVYELNSGVFYFYDGSLENQILKPLKQNYMNNREPRDAIIDMITYASNMIKALSLNPEQCAQLFEIVQKYRYDIEAFYNGYKGTFKVPKEFIDSVKTELKDTIAVECACGPGENLENLLKFLDFGIGCDISTEMAKKTNKKLLEVGNGFAFQGTAYKLPLRRDSVDGFMIFNAFDRIPWLRKLVKEIDRTVKNRGYLLIGGCEPPQWYSPADPRLVYVPENQRMTTDEIANANGFNEIKRRLCPWNVTSILDGYEKLETLVLFSKRGDVK